jgi:hypothetical protein
MDFSQILVLLAARQIGLQKKLQNPQGRFSLLSMNARGAPEAVIENK